LPNGQVQEERIARKGKHRRIRESRGENPTSKLMSLWTKGHNTSTIITKKQISHHTKTNITSIQQQTSRGYMFLLIKWWSSLKREKTTLYGC
jgi:hypothetical protein